jgi:magnesium chelatase subunit H
MKVVLVTMDDHLASAAERCSHSLQRQMPGLAFQICSASSWRDDDKALARCTDAVKAADLIIVTMLFMEDHFLPILDTLAAKRDHCDAMVCIMSAPQVMQLTRMGKFTVGGQSGGLMGLLKKLSPTPKEGDKKGESSSSAGAKQMAVLRRLPKLLRFIPGTAQDVRLFFLTMCYWLAGSESNIANMVQMLIKRYASGPREAFRALANPQEPVEYPELGVYHPHMKGRLSSQARDLPSINKDQPTVGLLLLRSYLLAGNTAHYDGAL